MLGAPAKLLDAIWLELGATVVAFDITVPFNEEKSAKVTGLAANAGMGVITCVKQAKRSRFKELALKYGSSRELEASGCLFNEQKKGGGYSRVLI